MTWLWLAIVVVLDGAAGLVGALLPDRWLARYHAIFLGFAIGALLASALGDLLPEAIARGGFRMLLWAIAAIAILAVAEWLAARRSDHLPPRVVPVALLGADALHNLGDGIAIASAFLVSTRLGLVTSFAVIVHELPEELADYALLRTAGLPRRTALIWLAAVQLAAGAGAAATWLVSSLLAPAQDVILANAGGTFVHIAAIDLLPAMVRTRRIAALVACAVGALCLLAVR
jgi:zinc and cadmium transporter